MPEDNEMMCPECGENMNFIEVCDSGEDENKTSWTCTDCDNIVYIIKFKR